MHRLLFAALAALVALVALPALAGSVQVTVLDKDGKPAPDVVVLVERPQRTAVQPAAEPVVVAQEDLRFVPFLTVVPAGSTVRFVNRDNYDHHVRSTPSGPLGAVAPASSFELRLATSVSRRGTSGDVTLVVPGPIGLGCHLHSSMRGQLYVAGTPWFGKTDARGVLTIEGVPEGGAELRLWHSDQLQEQVALPLVVTAQPLSVQASLNFTPRRRRGAG